MNSGEPYQQSAYPKYNRIKKKFPALLRKKLNGTEDHVAMDPSIGEEKKGNLKGIRVYKFKVLDEQILLAYQVNKDKREIVFVACGGHENFYRDLKEYLKK